MKKFYVYVDYKPDGTPFYVGKGLLQRVGQVKRNRWHQAICEKYPDWEREKVFEGTNEECIAEEIRLIALYGRRDKGEGPLVNLTDGGEGVPGFTCKRSEETKAKMSAANKGQKPSEYSIQRAREVNTGRKHTPEALAKISAAGKGRKMSEATKQKLREANLGRKFTPEELKKVSDSHKGIKYSAESSAKKSAKTKGIPRGPRPDWVKEKLSAAAKAYYANKKAEGLATPPLDPSIVAIIH